MPKSVTYVVGIICNPCARKHKNLGRPRRRRAWNKTRKVEYSLCTVPGHPMDRQSWNMSQSVGIFEYSATHAPTFLPGARGRRGLSHVNHLRGPPVAGGSRADCVRLRSRPRPSRSLPEGRQDVNEGLLQYRFKSVTTPFLRLPALSVAVWMRRCQLLRNPLPVKASP